jgi:hypothetical protein
MDVVLGTLRNLNAANHKAEDSLVQGKVVVTLGVDPVRRMDCFGIQSAEKASMRLVAVSVLQIAWMV